MTKEYVLEGSRITSLEAFYEEVGRVLLHGAPWGRNLDAFDDILFGGFGTPREGFTLRWTDSELSKRHLNYPETVRQLEARLGWCHPSNREAVQHDLDRARACDGPTVFDWLVDLIRDHGIGGNEPDDNIRLVLD